MMDSTFVLLIKNGCSGKGDNFIILVGVGWGEEIIPVSFKSTSKEDAMQIPVVFFPPIGYQSFNTSVSEVLQHKAKPVYILEGEENRQKQ